MDLFRMELYKILRRRPIWWLLTALLAFCVLWISAWASEEDTVVDGVRYHGTEAIERDREIARQWEGVLTVEKLQEILDTYGLAVNERAEWESPRGGNWVSRYATNMLTDFLSRDAHDGADFLDEEALTRTVWELERYAPHFCYMENANMLYEATFTVNLLVLLLITFALTPVFTEEYRCKTAPLIAGCERGRKKIAGIKIAAAVVFSLGMYMLVDIVLFLIFIAYYGCDWMAGGACLVNWIAVPRYMGLAIWQAYLLQFFWGMLGILVMVAVSLFFSVLCKQTFLAMAGSLLFLGGGYVLPVILMQFRVPRWLMRLTGWAFECNPYYLMTSVSRGSYLGELWRLLLIAVLLVGVQYAVRERWGRQEG